MRLKGTPMLDWQQAQLMLMILSLSLHMGDGTGVLFNRFLHLQEKQGHPTRRKSNIRDREGNWPFPLFLSAIFLIRFKKQHKGKGISWRGEREPICEKQEWFFLVRKGTGRDKGEMICTALRLILWFRLLASCLFYSLQHASRNIASLLSFLSHFPFPSLLPLPFNW